MTNGVAARLWNSSTGDRDVALVVEGDAGGPDDLPVIAVGVGEIAAVTAPEDVLSGFYDFSAGLLGELQYGGYFFFGSDVVSEGNSGESFGRFDVRTDVFGKLLQRIQRQSRAGGDKYRDLGVVLGAGGEAQSVAVKANRPWEV